jgi:OFA family oxalate/formate antiporter-like MFS transporter
MVKPAHIKYNRIIVLADLLGLLLFLGLIYAWSIFRAPLSGMFPDWSAVQQSWAFTISIASYCIMGLVASRLVKRVHPRVPIFISAAMILIGFQALGMLINTANPDASLIILYVFYGVFVGGGVGFYYNTSLGVVARNFPDRAGLATGTILLGFGLGGMILGALVNWLNGSFGLNATFTALGIILPVIVVIAALLVKVPEAPAPAPAPAASDDKDAPAPAPAPAVRSYTFQQAMASPAFWIMFVWLILISMGAMTVINSAALIAPEYGLPALVGLIVTVANGFGRPLGGGLLDAKGRGFTQYMICILMILGGAMLALGHPGGVSALIVLGLILCGVSYGCLAALSPVVLRFYGPGDYQSIVGISLCQMILAAIIGPILSSFLFQISGNYFSSYIVIMIAATLGLGVTFLLGVSARKEGLEEAKAK